MPTCSKQAGTGTCGNSNEPRLRNHGADGGRAFKTIEEAQAAVCLPFRTVEPDARATKTYDELYPLYRDTYFALGRRDAEPVALGRVLPELRRISAQARRSE